MNYLINTVNIWKICSIQDSDSKGLIKDGAKICGFYLSVTVIRTKLYFCLSQPLEKMLESPHLEKFGEDHLPTASRTEDDV